MNQKLDVRGHPFEDNRSRRFEQGADGLRPDGDSNRRRRNDVVSGQRERRTVVIVVLHLWTGAVIGVVGVVFEDAVRRRMAMDDDVRVACFVGFVDVLGRRHREQPQGRGQRAGEKPGQIHHSHRMRLASGATTACRLPRVNRSEYRGRLAPSPTGFLHVGHASTFWPAFQRALQAGGRLVLRDEDLDPQRSRPEYAGAMLEDLRWLGIRWDEGPDVGGPFGPYKQSERRAVYVDVWARLRRQGALYPCSCSRKDLADAAQAPHDNAENDEPVYSGRCRQKQSDATDPAGTTWRFRVPDGVAIRFDDGSAGAQTYTAGTDFGDFIVWRRDDVPAYQLAVVADDVAMKITEVVRGRDLLKSTARQLLIYEALGVTPPAFFHCPLVSDDTGQRLAKRHDAMSLHALRAAGVTPAEIIRGFPQS